MNKKHFILFGLVLLLPIVGFGCKGLSTTEQKAVKSVTVNYWTVYNDTAQIQKFATAFKQQYPHITVRVRKVRADQFDNLFVNALADDVPPDIISVNVRDLRNYQDRLSEMPNSVQLSTSYVTGKYFKETVVENHTINLPTVLAIRNNFIDTVLADAVISQKIYGLPLAVDTMAIYYNKDLLDQVGIPEPPKNWDEFMDAVKKTTRFDQSGNIIQSGVALGTGNNIPHAFDILSLFMMQSGVNMSRGYVVDFANGLDQLKNNHPTLSALRFYTDFAKDTKDVYSWNEKMEDALTSFTRGKSVFYFGYAYDYATIRSRAPQVNLEIIPMLQLNEQKPVNIADYWLESVVKKSKKKNEAWAFINFMATPENIKTYTKATRRPSPLRSQINEQKTDPVLSPFAGQILQAQNWYRGKNSTAAERAFSSLITNYLKPYNPNENQFARDSQLIYYTAQLVQQTM